MISKHITSYYKDLLFTYKASFSSQIQNYSICLIGQPGYNKRQTIMKRGIIYGKVISDQSKTATLIEWQWANSCSPCIASEGGNGTICFPIASPMRVLLILKLISCMDPSLCQLNSISSATFIRHLMVLAHSKLWGFYCNLDFTFMHLCLPLTPPHIACYHSLLGNLVSDHSTLLIQR